jgi:cell division septation protein DedD
VSTRREERRRESRRAWTRLAAQAVLCGTLGFVAGALAGVVVEAPGLVFAHVAGETERVELATLPAPPPPPGASRALPAVSAPARGPRLRGPRFVIQVGSFAERDSADQLRERLAGAGFPVFVEPGETAAGAGWRVRVGPVAGQDEAQRVAQRLKTEQRLPTWVQPASR